MSNPGFLASWKNKENVIIFPEKDKSSILRPFLYYIPLTLCKQEFQLNQFTAALSINYPLYIYHDERLNEY